MPLVHDEPYKKGTATTPPPTPAIDINNENEVQRQVQTITKKFATWKGQTTAVNNFLAIYDNKQIDVNKLEERFAKYLQLFNEFQRLTEELSALDEDGRYYSITELCQIEADYYSNIGKYEKLMARARGQLTSDSSDQQEINGGNTASTRRRIRLPESTLPIFNGEYENWISFREEFRSMINDQNDISDVDKLTYLRRSLKGSAYDKIKMFPISGDNYIKAWELLNQTYSDERLIASRHLNLLLDLPRQEKESAQGLSKLVDDTRQHLELLKSLQINIPEQMMVTILERKLYKNTADDWDETLKQGIFPTLNEMFEFLAKRAARLAIRNKEVTTTSKPQHQRNTRNYHENKNAQHTFIINTNENKCNLCKKDKHSIHKCNQFLQASIQERRKLVRELLLCFNCLKTGHRSTECKSSNCRACGNKHNTLLHYEDSQEATSNTEA